MTTFIYKATWNASRVNVLFDVFQAWPIISLKSNTWAISSGFNLHTILLVCDTICIYYSVFRLFAAIFKPSWFRTNTKRSRLRYHYRRQKGEIFILMFVGLGLNSTPQYPLNYVWHSSPWIQQLPKKEMASRHHRWHHHGVLNMYHNDCGLKFPLKRVRNWILRFSGPILWNNLTTG